MKFGMKLENSSLCTVVSVSVTVTVIETETENETESEPKVEVAIEIPIVKMVSAVIVMAVPTLIESQVFW